MVINENISNSAAGQIFDVWGSRWPTWEEFKRAKAEGRVRINKTIAAQAIYSKAVPTISRIFFGYILLWFGFLIIPITIGFWLFANISLWWILGSAILTWFLIKISKEGHCQGIADGAERDEGFYQFLVQQGAFLFTPGIDDIR